MLTPEKIAQMDKVAGVSTPTPISQSQIANTSRADEIRAIAKKAQSDKQSTISKIGGAIISSEKAFGEDIAGGLSSVLPKTWTGQSGIDEANRAKQEGINTAIKGLHQAQQTGGDTKKWLNILSQTSGEPIKSIEDLYPALKKSNLQVLGDASGVLLDVLSAGSYGNAIKGSESGKLLVKSGGTIENLAGKIGLGTTEKVAQPIIKEGAKQTLGQTIKTIGKETAKQSAISAGAGYGFDVSQNLQSGKTGTEALKPGMGTILGGTIPAVIGGIRVGSAITKASAPKFINSLIKPKQADFSYGKDPGRTVSEMGITGNNMDDFGKNIGIKKNEVGTKIGKIYSSPENSTIKLNLSDDVAKIDSAIETVAKGGKNNQNIVTQLQNIKDALLYNHAVDKEGNIIKTGEMANLSNIGTEGAFDLKKKVSGLTQFTGRPSDDKTVNGVLKSIYGGIKEKLNKSVGVNNPEITKLNQQYADLTSAELATLNREAIVKRADVISMPIKVGSVGAIISAVTTGGAAIPVVLAGVGAGLLDKALESTAVKTRIASWLGSESPSVIKSVIQKNPEIGIVLKRALPKFSSQLGE